MTSRTKINEKTRTLSEPAPNRIERAERKRYSFEPRTPRVSLILVGVLLGIALGFIWASELLAMPPHPRIIEGIRTGQLLRPYYLENRESLLRAGVDAATPRSGRLIEGPLAKASISGTQNFLTILVDFSDKASQVNAIKFDTLVYVDRTGTVRNYYKEISYNTLTIATINLPSALGWRRVSQTLAYYANNQNGLGSYPQNAQKLVEDAVDLIDSLLNFSQYDNDDDGYVDGLMVVHSGQGAEYTGLGGDIWSHKWAINPRLKDGVYISTYSMEPEYWASPGDMTCGVYCHELGHVFGLPDLYDTDYSSEGIGRWSLMAAGSWNGTLGNSPAHPDAWCKIELGFVSPIVPSLNLSGASIYQVELNQSIYKVWTNGSPGNEYFLLENRQRTGYDTYLPSEGLLIWHIDETRSNNDSEWWPGCGWSPHLLVGLVQADNLWHLEHNTNSGDGGDPFPGTSNKRQIAGSTSPGTNTYSGSATNVAIENISNSQAVMTADITVNALQDIDDGGPAMPGQIELLGNYPNPFNSYTDIKFAVKTTDFVDLSVYDIRGAFVRTIFAGQIEAGIHRFSWEGVDQGGNEASSGIYFYRLSAIGQNVCKMMSLLK